MKLLRIGVANFRSIGSQPVMLDLQKRINLLIGANNAGKSNVLTIFQRLVKLNEEKIAVSDTDRFRRDKQRELEFYFDLVREKPDEMPNERVTVRGLVSGQTILVQNSPFEGLDYYNYTPYMRRWDMGMWQSLPSEHELASDKLECTIKISRCKSFSVNCSAFAEPDSPAGAAKRRRA